MMYLNGVWSHGHYVFYLVMSIPSHVIYIYVISSLEMTFVCYDLNHGMICEKWQNKYVQSITLWRVCLQTTLPDLATVLILDVPDQTRWFAIGSPSDIIERIIMESFPLQGERKCISLAYSETFIHCLLYAAALPWTKIILTSTRNIS